MYRNKQTQESGAWTDGVLIIMNSRFVPDVNDGRYIYGVVQHAIHIAEVFSWRNIPVGFVLYRRSDSAGEPQVRRSSVVDKYPASIVEYNMMMLPEILKSGFSAAIDLVSHEIARSTSNARPLLYLQTDVLLSLMPKDFNILITHHSPFVADVCDKLGVDDSRRAFEWDHPKMSFLDRMQSEALEVFRANDNIVGVEISSIQKAYLIRAGVDPKRVYRLPPPVAGVTDSGIATTEVFRTLDRLRKRTRTTVVTAVSRLDHFKNIDLFVAGCIYALRQGAIEQALIVGGEVQDVERDRLMGLIPEELLPKFVFLPRLPHAVLVGQVFPALAGASIFACTSRYDLVPFTVLEAARRGLCTIVPNNGTVGAADYLPDEYKFSPSAEGFGNILERLADDPSSIRRFRQTAKEIRSISSDEAVFASLQKACSFFKMG